MWAPHEQRALEVEKVKAELLTPDSGAATRVHFVDGDTVWLDTDIGVRDGLVIGIGRTKRHAIEDAICELRQRIVDMQRVLDGEIRVTAART